MNARISAAHDRPPLMQAPTASAPPLGSSTRLLVVAPHPDDETIATGVLIQQVLALGGQVRALSLTAGDNNPWPQRWLERRMRIGPAERVRWGVKRHDELLGATAELGLDAAHLRTLGWADQGLTDRLRNALEESVSALRAQLEDFAPTLVAIPALDDHHPDHSAAHVMTRLAIAAMAQPPLCIAYCIHAATGVLGEGQVQWPASESMQSRKQVALECHVSQLALSGGRMRRFAARPERYRLITGDRDGHPGDRLPWRPSRWLAPWLRFTVANDHGSRSWPWLEAPLRRDEQGHYRLVTGGKSFAGHCFARLELRLPMPWIFDHWGWCELRI